jgi:hypothetical protein
MFRDNGLLNWWQLTAAPVPGSADYRFRHYPEDGGLDDGGLLGGPLLSQIVRVGYPNQPAELAVYRHSRSMLTNHGLDHLPRAAKPVLRLQPSGAGSSLQPQTSKNSTPSAGGSSPAPSGVR